MAPYQRLTTINVQKTSHPRSHPRSSKLSEVLEQWLPEADDDEGGPFARGRRRPAAGADLSSLFNCHPTIVAHLAPVLLRLYNDIEHTERPGAFYFKFNMRVTIANILKYLWAQPQHRWGWGGLVGCGRGCVMNGCGMDRFRA